MNRYRLKYFYIFIIVAFLILFSRMLYLQIIVAPHFRALAKENTIRKIPIRAERGEIYSTDGVILAKNSIYFKLSLLSFEIENLDETLKKLKTIISLTPQEEERVRFGVAQNMMEPVLVKDMLNYETFCRLAEIKADYKGIYLEVQPIRDYPLKNVGAHILGYDGFVTESELKSQKGLATGDIIGKDGLEQYYDKEIRGKKGAARIQVDVRGRMITSVGTDFPTVGDNLLLTIDSRLQRFCNKELATAIHEIEAVNGEPSGGAVVVMNVNSGAILAMASYPDYDPNLFSQGISSKDYNKIILNPATPLLNRVIQGAYPCASTFKLITSAAALQEGLITGRESLYCSGKYDLDGHIFNCFVTTGHGTISFKEAIAYSCDVVFYMLATKFNLNKFLQYIADFGLGKQLGIDLPGESSGLLPTPEWKQKTYDEDWFPGDTVNLSIGQGFVEVTPLQVVSFTAATANGGTLYKPYVVQKLFSNSGRELKDRTPQIIRKIPVEPKYFQLIREGMHGAVEYGTAKAAYNNKISIAGKTGTAENFPTQYNPYGRNHTWFTGFAPYEHPEIAVTVFLEKSGGFGGQKSCLTGRHIFEKYAELYKKK